MKKIMNLKDFIGIDTFEDICFVVRENFIKRRKEMKLSRQKLADISGINIGVIKRYEENGYISLTNLIELACAMQYEQDFKQLFATPYIKDLYENKK